MMLKITFFILSGISLTTFASGQTSLCENAFAQTQAECDALKQWMPKGLSEPDKLEDSPDFKIIYHSITGRGFHAGLPLEETWAYKLLMNPTLIAHNPRISTSLISNEKHSTYLGYIGLVLEVPTHNIIGTGPSDRGSMSSEYKELIERSRFSDWDILTPNDLLSKTGKNNYNEVILLGTDSVSGSQVKPTAVIVDCPSVQNITLLNRLNDSAFRSRLLQCMDASTYFAIPLLEKLRNKYPIYTLSTYR